MGSGGSHVSQPPRPSFPTLSPLAPERRSQSAPISQKSEMPGGDAAREGGSFPAPPAHPSQPTVRSPAGPPPSPPPPLQAQHGMHSGPQHEAEAWEAPGATKRRRQVCCWRRQAIGKGMWLGEASAGLAASLAGLAARDWTTRRPLHALRTMLGTGWHSIRRP